MSEEEQAKLILYLINFLVPILIIPTSIPMMKGMVKPNRWYGFRTKKTLSDDDIWYQANAYSGRELLVAGLVGLLGLLLLLPLYGMVAIWPFLAASWVFVLLPLVFAVVRSFLFLAKL